MARYPNLNRKLVLEEPQRLSDGAGGFNQIWVELGSLWAELRPGTGRERAEDVTQVSRMAWRIIVRGAPEGATSRPKPEQRLREGGRVFRITAVAEYDSQAQYLTCFAEEEVSA